MTTGSPAGAHDEDAGVEEALDGGKLDDDQGLGRGDGTAEPLAVGGHHPAPVAG